MRPISTLGRLALGASFPLLAFLVPAGAATTTAGCGDSDGCKTLRQAVYNELVTWEECDPTDPNACIVESGNPKDCTGVLACTFAINPKFRTQAELTVLEIPEQSTGCYLCATPACQGGTTATCEVVTGVPGGRCMLISTGTVEDGGGGSSLDSSIPYYGGDAGE